MQNNIIDIYYFSGTGNTYLVVKKMAEVFTKKSMLTNLYKIEKTDPQKIDQKNTIGLAFPVANQSTFPFIWNFIRSLPSSKGTNIFMVDTLHSFSGAIVGPLKKILIKKGYNPIGAKEIIMVNNVYRTKINEKEKDHKINEGLKQAEQYALSIINGTSKWPSIPILPAILYFLVSRKVLWNFIAFLGKRFRVDKVKCTKCELCYKLCPVQNITMPDYPEYGDKCEQCLRCVMHCPEEAIRLPIWKYVRYKAVDGNKLL